MAGTPSPLTRALELSQLHSTPYGKYLGGGPEVPDDPKVVENIPVQVSSNPIALHLAVSGIIVSEGLGLLRNLATALSIIVGKTDTNPTGSPTAPETWDPFMKGSNKYQVVNDKAQVNDTYVEISVVKRLIEMERNELASAVGSFVLALTKTVTDQNITAFTTKRAAAAMSTSTLSDPQIFVDNSYVLNTRTLGNVNNAAVAYPAVAGRLICYIADNFKTMTSGIGEAFTIIVQLLEGSGLTALDLIHEGLNRFPYAIEGLVEVSKDLTDYSIAITNLRAAPANRQSLLKAIHRRKYVPIPPNSILAGIYWELLRTDNESLANYAGPRVPSEIMAKVLKNMSKNNPESEL